MLLDLLEDDLTAVEPVQEENEGSSEQSIVKILGARLVTNELFADEIEDESHTMTVDYFNLS